MTGWDVNGLRIIRRLAFGDEEYVRHKNRSKYRTESVVVMAMDRMRGGCDFAARLTYIHGGDPRRLGEMFHLFIVAMYKYAKRLLDPRNLMRFVGMSMSFRRSLVNKLQHPSHDHPFNPQSRLGEDTCIGFVDASMFSTCRPGATNEGANNSRNGDLLQRAFYTQYKSVHGLKLLLVTLANGLTGHLAIDSVRASDVGMVRSSKLNEVLQEYSEAEGEATNVLSVYGDRIFVTSKYLRAPNSVSRYITPGYANPDFRERLVRQDRAMEPLRGTYPLPHPPPPSPPLSLTPSLRSVRRA